MNKVCFYHRKLMPSTQPQSQTKLPSSALKYLQIFVLLISKLSILSHFSWSIFTLHGQNCSLLQLWTRIIFPFHPIVYWVLPSIPDHILPHDTPLLSKCNCFFLCHCTHVVWQVTHCIVIFGPWPYNHFQKLYHYLAIVGCLLMWWVFSFIVLLQSSSRFSWNDLLLYNQQ